MSKRRASRWLRVEVDGQEFLLINFDHKSVETIVMEEMDTGFDVYYDTRWSITTEFANWLADNANSVANKSVLILGAGAGLETLLLAKHAREIVINDLSDVSLNLCKEQLERNGLSNYRLLPGDYTKVNLPPECEIAVACFSIYCPVTATAVSKFLKRYQSEVLIINEPLKAFRNFLTTIERPYRVIKEWDGGQALRFPATDKDSA